MNIGRQAWKDKSASSMELWKEILKNGQNTQKILSELGSAWLPEIICADTCLGGAFFLREAFPKAFICSFAAMPASPFHLPAFADLYCRLCLHSSLCYAEPEGLPPEFPHVLRQIIRPIPLFVDSGYFSPGSESDFTCWKFTSAEHRVIALILTHLPGQQLSRWFSGIKTFLQHNKKHAAVALVNKGCLQPEDLKSLDLRGEGQRLYIADFLDRSAWRNLCRSAESMIFTGPGQKSMALERLACGHDYYAAAESDAVDLSARNVEADDGSTWGNKAPARKDQAAEKKKALSRFELKKVIPGLAEEILECFRSHKG